MITTQEQQFLTKFQKQSKAKFSKEDDMRLIHLVLSMPHPDWFWISKQMINRNPRQCRERWFNYLDPTLHKGDWTEEEDEFLLDKYKEFGPHWNAIARFFNGRSGNAVRNRWLLLQRHTKKEKNVNEFNNEEIDSFEPQNDKDFSEIIEFIFQLKEKIDLFNITNEDLIFLQNFF